MSRILVTNRPGFFSRLVHVGFLPADREGRSMEATPTRVPEEPGTMDVREVRSSRWAWIIAPDLDHHAEGLDAVAGSEFVDDRIRLRE
jgi:hypothetical protein